MDPLIELDLGEQHLNELREAASVVSLARQLPGRAGGLHPAGWRRSIGRVLIAGGRRLGGEAPVACPD